VEERGEGPFLPSLSSLPIFPAVTPSNVIVTAGGLAAIIWVLWYFLVPSRRAR